MPPPQKNNRGIQNERTLTERHGAVDVRLRPLLVKVNVSHRHTADRMVCPFSVYLVLRSNSLRIYKKNWELCEASAQHSVGLRDKSMEWCDAVNKTSNSSFTHYFSTVEL